MTFADIPVGESIFLDANVLTYHFTNDPIFGSACTDLLERIENNEIAGFSSATVLVEVSHRLMTIEAVSAFKWPSKGIAWRLRKNPAEVQKLSRYRQALDEI